MFLLQQPERSDGTNCASAHGAASIGKARVLLRGTSSK